MIDISDLEINFYNLSKLQEELEKTAKETSDYADELSFETVRSINYVTGGSTTNLLEANNLVKQKVEQLRDKSARCKRMAVQINELSELADTIDHEVAALFVNQNDMLINRNKILEISNLEDTIIGWLIETENNLPVLENIAKSMNVSVDNTECTKNEIKNLYFRKVRKKLSMNRATVLPVIVANGITKQSDLKNEIQNLLWDKPRNKSLNYSEYLNMKNILKNEYVKCADDLLPDMGIKKRINTITGMEQLDQKITKDTFIKNIQQQYGFDVRTCNLLYDIYIKINKKYIKQNQQVRDWYFARAISQLGGYNDKKVNVLIISIETNAWRKGAGWAYEYDEEKKFFCEMLAISEEDYQYLRYNIRLQHFMSGDENTYSYNKLIHLEDCNKEEFELWKKNMEKAVGETLSNEAYKAKYNELYQRYHNQGDYSHMMYTLSANLIENGYKVDNSWNNVAKSEMSWKTSEERKDISGWLGDAVYTGDKDKGVTFSDDDYIADLDADNIAYRMKDGLNLIECTNQYYRDLAQGNEDELRTKEFLKNNDYNKVEEAVLNRIEIKDMNKDGKKTVEDLENSKKYKDTYNFLMRLRRFNGEG